MSVSVGDRRLPADTRWRAVQALLNARYSEVEHRGESPQGAGPYDPLHELPAATAPPPRSGAALLLSARGLRAFADGFVALLLPVYLTQLGFDAFATGILTTATLLGSAVLTFGVGLTAHFLEPRRLLVASSLLMFATGICFALFGEFWPLVIIGFVGTLNPTSGDVSLFLPLEQSLLSHGVADDKRTALFARYSLVGSLFGALGALAAAVPEFATAILPPDFTGAPKAMFVLYGLFGLMTFTLYRRLPQESADDVGPVKQPLAQSRRI